ADAALASLAEDAVCLADHVSITGRAGFAEQFVHVFVLDPPPFPELHDALARSAPAAGEGFLHLGWGPAELEFAQKLLEHEFSLRPALVSLYRALAPSPE